MGAPVSASKRSDLARQVARFTPLYFASSQGQNREHHFYPITFNAAMRVMVRSYMVRTYTNVDLDDDSASVPEDDNDDDDDDDDSLYLFMSTGPLHFTGLETSKVATPSILSYLHYLHWVLTGRIVPRVSSWRFWSINNNHNLSSLASAR
jgi:hypothetical protein